MKNMFVSACCILFFTCAVAQQESRKYACLFTDTLGVIDAAIQADSMKQSLQQKGLPHEITERITEKVFSRPEAYLLTLSRSVSTDGDSSLIRLNYHSAPGKTLIANGSGIMKFSHGRLLRYDPANEVFHPVQTPETSALFSPTGRKQSILGFACDEYISADSIYRIWITKQLPPAINPGVAVMNVEGAVISFETRHNNAYTRSTLSLLEEISDII